MTKKIQLTQGKFALVDDEDFEYLSQWKWYYHHGYAVRGARIISTRKRIYLHKEIMKTPDGMDTDHVNGKTLDNTRANLRVCTHSENLMNQKKRKDNSSGYKGVSLQKITKRWKAYIMVNQKQIHLGYFDNSEDASKAYNEASKKYFGNFHRTTPT